MRLGGDSGGGGRLDGGRVPQHRWARSSRWARTEATASSEQTSRCAPHGIPTRNGRAAFTDHTPTYRSRGAGRPRRPSPAAARAAERNPVVGTRAARIALSIWPTEIDLQYLLFRLSFSSQVVSTSLSSYPACSSEPWSVASPILRSGAARPDTCAYGPLFVFHVHVDEHVIMYSTPPWTLSSNSAANGSRGGRPRAPRAARPSQA